jgi:hypothetical protein
MHQRCCSPTRGVLRESLALLLGLFAASPAWADPIVGQIDTFENGNTAGWMIGNPLARNPPVTDPFTPPAIAAGGPGGAGDHFMLLTADDVRAGGRLTVFNRAQWAGNFLAAGVNQVEMDLKNFGNTPLSIRVALKNGIGIGNPGYSSTTAFMLPADGEWHHAVFALDAADLTPLGNPPPLSALLANVAEFRILDSPTPSLNGVNITGQLGVDNILADVIPEPSGLALLAAGLGGLAAVRGLRRNRRGK